MVQHELFLGVKHRAVRTLEHRHFVVAHVLIEVSVEQGLQGENCVTHGALINEPGKKTRKTQSDLC